jgi:hypothetical protein
MEEKNVDFDSNYSHIIVQKKVHYTGKLAKITIKLAPEDCFRYKIIGK